MAKEVNLYKFCGSPQMKEKLWRDMFISYIFGVDMPENISVCRLPDDIRDILSAKDFSPALASLLIIYGGGYLDNDTFAYMAGDCDNYADEIAEVERILIEQAAENTEDRYDGNVIRNVLLCAIYSKKFDVMQQIDIQSSFALYDSQYTFIKNGFVYLKDKGFLEMLLENDAEFANAKLEDRKYSLDKLTKNEVEAASPEQYVLLDIKDVAYLTAVYKKPYYKEFLQYVKSENILFDDKFLDAYEEYVHKCKMKFTVRVYPRRRKICTKFPCWFDYNVPDNTALETFEDDLTEVVGKETEYDEAKLTNIALDRYLRRRAMIPETVLEVTHGDKIYFFIMKTDKEYDRLDNETFRKIPFDFDDIWTTISEWSRDKKIRKELIGGKSEIAVSPESEWEKIKPRDREYAKRLIEEQVQLREEQLSKNKFMQKLCELKSNAHTELKTKQEEAAKKKQEIADKKAQYKAKKDERKETNST